MPLLSYLSGAINLKEPFVTNVANIQVIVENIYVALVLFTISAIAAASARIYLIYKQNIVSYSIGNKIGSQAFRKHIYSDYETQISIHSSLIIDNIAFKAHDVILTTLQPLLAIMSSLCLLSIMLLGLISLNPIITFYTIFFFLLIYSIITIITRRVIYRNSIIVSMYSAKLIKILQEAIGSTRDVILGKNQKYFLDQFVTNNKILREAQGQNQIITQVPRYVVETAGFLLIAYSLYKATSENINLSTTLPMIGIFLICMQKMLPHVQNLYSSLNIIKSGYPSLNLLINMAYIETNEKTYEKIKNFEEFHSLEMNNVFYKYPRAENCALSSISLKINRGDILGITGKTGSGKSTLLDLLLGLLSHEKGSITLNSTELCERSRSKLHQLITHVPQNIYLTSGTISSNIAFGLEPSEIDKDHLVDSAIKSKIHDEIMRLPKNYDTVIGERGVTLSGGQVQRIGIARALYRNSEIIVLDEATSSLDSETEYEIMKSIIEHNRKKTVLIVAHRLSTLKYCNKIVKVNNGYIEWSGTYSEMINIESKRV